MTPLLDSDSTRSHLVGSTAGRSRLPLTGAQVAKFTYVAVGLCNLANVPVFWDWKKKKWAPRSDLDTGFGKTRVGPFAVFINAERLGTPRCLYGGHEPSFPFSHSFKKQISCGRNFSVMMGSVIVHRWVYRKEAFK